MSSYHAEAHVEAPAPAQAKPVRLRAADGCEISAQFYPARRPRLHRRAAIVHCGGGVPARSYRRFADFLCEFGIPVLTYDYRGIGQSRPAQLRGCAARFEDWIEYDSAAAIGWLRERFPGDEIIGISHSIGVFPLTAAPNAAEQDRLVMISPHTGYFGDYRARYRVPMALVWHGVMPLLTWMFGYFPGRRLRLGEDLPAGFAMQWAGRLLPQIRLAGAGNRMDRLLRSCAALERPALVVTISDDAFSTEAGARRILGYLPRLSSRQIAFAPAEANLARLGHFGFFRQRGGPVLWPKLLALIDPQIMPLP